MSEIAFFTFAGLEKMSHHFMIGLFWAKGTIFRGKENKNELQEKIWAFWKQYFAAHWIEMQSVKARCFSDAAIQKYIMPWLSPRTNEYISAFGCEKNISDPLNTLLEWEMAHSLPELSRWKIVLLHPNFLAASEAIMNLLEKSGNAT